MHEQIARRAAFVLGVSLLVISSWAIGRAQSAVSEFQVTISLDTAPGALSVACDRGCEWSSRVANLECDSQPCRWTFTGYGPVTLGMPRGVSGAR